MARYQSWLFVLVVSTIVNMLLLFLIAMTFANIWMNNRASIRSTFSSTIVDRINSISTIEFPPRFHRINRVEPLNIHEILSSCNTTVNTPFETIVEQSIEETKCKEPKSSEEFVCLAHCTAVEEELETSVRILRTGNHSASQLVSMCKRKVMPILVWYSHHQNKLRHVFCVPESRMMGPNLWQEAHRLLVMVTCMVQVARKDFLFGFDPSDFSLPTFHAPFDTMHYMSPVPGVLRFVGDSAHNPLLFPTTAHIVATGLCKYRSRKQFWRHCNGSPEQSIPYENRSKALFWRGLPTGSAWTADKWTFMQRMALIRDFGEKPGFDVGFVRDVKGFANASAVLYRLVKSAWLEKPPILREHHSQHAHLLHLDGNSASWGLSHKLSSGSTLIWVASQHGYREHFYHLLKPWVHYIPITVDLSDLKSASDWIFSHPQEVAAIAKRAMNLVETRMRPQDLYCYVYRLLASIAEAQQPEMDPAVTVFNSMKLREYLGEDLFDQFKEMNL